MGRGVRGRSMGSGTQWTDGLKTGLVHLWEFDGNANDAIGGANGTATGDVSFTNGKMKQCVNLVGGYITASKSMNLASWTVSFWLKQEVSATSNHGVMNQSVNANNYGIRITNRAFNYAYANNQAFSVVEIEHLGVWKHFVARFPNSKLVVDGVEIGLTNVMRELYIPDTIYIGVDNYSLSQRLLRGYLEQLVIWNRALSDAEMLKLYNSGKGLKY
jgi:hypothetical protein